MVTLRDSAAGHLIIGPQWLERFELFGSIVQRLSWGDEVTIHQWQVSHSELIYDSSEERGRSKDQEVYLREVFISDSVLRGAIFEETTVTAFMRLDRVDLGDEVLASAKVEGECRISESLISGDRVFEKMSRTFHVTAGAQHLGEYEFRVGVARIDEQHFVQLLPRFIRRTGFEIQLRDVHGQFRQRETVDQRSDDRPVQHGLGRVYAFDRGFQLIIPDHDLRTLKLHDRAVELGQLLAHLVGCLNPAPKLIAILGGRVDRAVNEVQVRR